MDTLSIEWRATDEPSLDDLEAVPHVNGESLVAAARRAELPSATAGGQAEIAGGYGGLPPAIAVGPSSVLLRRAVASSDWPNPELYVQGDRVTLLVCECGEPGCWPLEARVEVDDERVRWSDFRQPHRPRWDLSSLGPFEFDRREYEAAVRAAEERIRAPRRAP